jgi:hypothetical protein
MGFSFQYVRRMSRRMIHRFLLSIHEQIIGNVMFARSPGVTGRLRVSRSFWIAFFGLYHLGFELSFFIKWNQVPGINWLKYKPKMPIRQYSAKNSHDDFFIESKSFNIKKRWIT